MPIGVDELLIELREVPQIGQSQLFAELLPFGQPEIWLAPLHHVVCDFASADFLTAKGSRASGRSGISTSIPYRATKGCARPRWNTSRLIPGTNGTPSFLS
jgi:hypothetical protein